MCLYEERHEVIGGYLCERRLEMRLLCIVEKEDMKCDYCVLE